MVDTTNTSEKPAGRTRWNVVGLPPIAIAFLLLTIVLALARSHAKMIWTDEFYALETGSVPSALTLIRCQLRTPTVPDPIVYNLVAHAAIKAFGAVAFAIRFPSLCGYVLMQLCLFVFVRRIAGERAATFALAMPALIGNFVYAAQGRPYGMLMGWVALAMVSWQSATRRSQGQNRVGALICLAIAIALAINTHYYGLLVLVPLWGAELYRSLSQKRLDWPVLLALAGGTASILVLLPFAKALRPFQAHHFEMRQVEYHYLTHAYPWMLVGNVNVTIAAQHTISLGLGIGLVGILWGFFTFRKGFKFVFPPAEAVFVVLLTALPFYAFVFALYVTKIVEGRYALPTVLGIITLLALAMAPVMQQARLERIIFGLLFVAIMAGSVARIRADRMDGMQTMRSLQLDPDVVRMLDGTPDKPIYVMSASVFQVVSYYAPNPELRSRLKLVYSHEDEMRVQHSDFLTLTVINMHSIMPDKVISWESLRKEPGPQMMLLFHDPAYDWTDSALAASGAKQQFLGRGFCGGDLVSVQFMR
jgi:4-amino-4-deoxy-L-arabinose transferase-like glycosyltransferase